MQGRTRASDGALGDAFASRLSRHIESFTYGFSQARRGSHGRRWCSVTIVSMSGFQLSLRWSWRAGLASRDTMSYLRNRSSLPRSRKLIGYSRIHPGFIVSALMPATQTGLAMSLGRVRSRLHRDQYAESDAVSDSDFGAGPSSFGPNIDS